jgi:hypothetical protein
MLVAGGIVLFVFVAVKIGDLFLKMLLGVALRGVVICRFHSK